MSITEMGKPFWFQVKPLFSYLEHTQNFSW